MYAITNAYDIREDLKAVGGTFDRISKTWIISDEAYAKLSARTHSFGMRWVRGWAKAVKTAVEV